MLRNDNLSCFIIGFCNVSTKFILFLQLIYLFFTYLVWPCCSHCQCHNMKTILYYLYCRYKRRNRLTWLAVGEDEHWLMRWGSWCKTWYGSWEKSHKHLDFQTTKCSKCKKTERGQHKKSWFSYIQIIENCKRLAYS